MARAILRFVTSRQENLPPKEEEAPTGSEAGIVKGKVTSGGNSGGGVPAADRAVENGLQLTTSSESWISSCKSS